MAEQTTTTKASYRAWIQSEHPTIGFFPWGLLGLLLLLGSLLFGVTHFADAWIEDEVESAVRTTLDAEGFDDVEIVEVSGQEVVLGGPVREARGEDAIELASGALGPTAFGRHVAPTVVSGDFEEPVVDPDREPDSDPIPAPEPELPAEWANLHALIVDGVLTLRGEVASEDERDDLMTLANDNLDPPRFASVVDELTIAAGPIKDSSKELAERAMMSLSRCSRGAAHVESGVFRLSCQAPGELVDALKADAEAPFDGEGSVGEIEVFAAESVDECEGAFAELLAGEAIRFDTGSANVSRRSFRLLGRIAEVAANCPGRLRIEGHTDNQGDFDANMELSRQRAQAVFDQLVTREIEEARLLPVGYGPTRPRAEGDTAFARSQNRRIEFRVIVGDDTSSAHNNTSSENSELSDSE